MTLPDVRPFSPSILRIGFQIPIDRRGNIYLMAIAAFNLIILYPGTRMYYIFRNNQRDKIWNAMTERVRKNRSPVSARMLT